MNLLQQIQEGLLIPVSIKLILSEIIAAGKVTNPAQIFVLGYISEYFKKNPAPGTELEAPITFDSMATHTELVDALKAMSPQDQVTLAQYLLDLINKNNVALVSGAGITTWQWINSILQQPSE